MYFFSENDYDQVNDLSRFDRYDELFNNNLNDSNYYNAFNTENPFSFDRKNKLNLEEEEENSLNNKNITINSLKTKNSSEKKSKNNNSNIKPNSSNSPKSKTKTKIFTIREGPIFEIIKTNKKNLGRKRKGNNQNSKHNKYDGDNIIRKVKCFLINALLRIINSSIKTIQITKKEEKKKFFLLRINQKIIQNINIDYNLNFLKWTLRELFSNDIGKKYKKIKKSHNREIIQSLYKNNNYTKTTAILNITIKECLDYLSESNFNYELQGLEKEYQKKLDSFKKNGESEEYINLFKYYIKNFENYYNNKKKNKKNKKNDKERQ